ncbi:MAG: hypothetical protein KGZ66_00935, partial [Selenomonadales bacterium]|nr:hypothetical protein [Selenomonadales bacterium]
IANRTILQSAVERYNIDNGNWPVTGRALPTGATVVPLVGPDLANYLQGGVLPPVNVASMGDPDGTGPLTGDTLTTHRWGINAAGVVIIVNAAGDAVVWHP